MGKKTLELWVGLFILAGLAALAMLAMKVGNMNAGVKDGYQITARFENVGGLNIKAPVMIGGVRVGRVSDIRIDKDDYSALVEMAVDSHYDNLPLDTSAAVLTSGLLGAQFVGLEPGGDDIFLKNGDELELTQSAIQLESLIGQFMFNKAADGVEK
ncbi:MAG: outer membrane lipid asymmetry maintenance protein MlaD [Pseudomonadota bacterium]|nr:outer membrane lipid asymmetry maintenance protein MlaD [Pseudomonadota bacterium]